MPFTPAPFQGGSGDYGVTGTQQANGGYLLPPEQGEILVKGLLVETGLLQLAGDAKSTSSRRTNFPLWLGQPDADFVNEGAPKPLTNAQFTQASIDIKKIASIVVFTDEMIEDLMSGDLSVLTDAGVRQAISKRVDKAGVGYPGNGITQPFTSTTQDASVAAWSLVGNTFPATGVPSAVTLPLTGTVSGVDDELQKAVSSAMAVLESNGYGDPGNLGVLLGFGFQQKLRDARRTDGMPLYDGGTFAGQSVDALYGLSRAHSTNLAQAQATAPVCTGAGTVGSTANVYIGAPIVTTSTGVLAGYVKTITSGTAFTAIEPDGSTSLTTTTSMSILQPKAVVLHKPNVHARVRQDVSVTTSNEATLVDSSSNSVSLFQNNLFAVRYECRLGLLIHDPLRSVIPIWG